MQQPTGELTPVAIAEKTALSAMQAWALAIWKWTKRLYIKKPLGAAGLSFILLASLSAIFAPLITPYGPLVQDYTVRLTAPGAAHWLGTDDYGRDLYTRIVYGARISLSIAIVAVFTEKLLSLAVGVFSGYIGGWVDMLIMRIADIFLTFPAILLIMALIAMLGVGIDKLIIAFVITGWAGTARVIRGQVLSIKNNDYVEAARSIGASKGRIMLRHIMPQTLAPWLILFSAALANIVLTEASLSYLGLGVPPPHPSWGRMLSEAAPRAMSAPWLVIFPGLAITLFVLAFNLFGDALRDVWDPRLRGR
ncbi:MAG: ABC transporter permease [Chloroflexi bacterium]|nr:ABC transporter permease [Chloroflexota bacterium]